MYVNCPGGFASLKAFDDIELPPFTLITGLNGAGKSQLLQAMQGHSAPLRSTIDRNSLIPISRIIRRDWNTLVPNELESEANVGAFDKRQAQWREYQLALERFRIHVGEDSSILSDPGAVRRFFQSVDFEGVCTRICDVTGKSPLELTYDDFQWDMLRGISSNEDIFRQSFTQLFAAYTRMVQENHLRSLKSGQSPRSQAEFEELNGPPPWEFVNEILSRSGIGFHLEAPEMDYLGPFRARLLSDHGISLKFSDLSSGEKILMSFALAVYNSNDLSGRASYASALLLDEVDAPLHPAMSQTMLDVIQDVLIAKYGMHVIATTHSPSTVALAPESALFLMEKGVPGLKKVRKAEALNALTVGVPTVAIDYEGRRQVFTESDADAKTYSALYGQLRDKLPARRSLEFIGTGTKSGCPQVYMLVNGLTENGNRSVYGLVDSDCGSNKGNERVVILANGNRDGLENVLLDPLLLAAFLCHSYPSLLPKIGLTEAFTFSSLCNLDTSKLQDVVDKVALAVHGDAAPDAQKTKCSYLGDFSLQIDSRCLTLDDHAYEDRIKVAFDDLKEWHRAGELLQRIVCTVIREHPDFTPCDAIETFEELLERAPHF